MSRDQSKVNAVAFTGCFTAGLRFIESTCVPHPLIPSDPLAGILAGDEGVALAVQELEQLELAQGPGRHLRVPARSRLIDDMLHDEITALRGRRPQAAAAAAAGAVAGEAPPSSQPRTEHDTDHASGAAAGSGAGLRPRGSETVCQVVSLGAGMCTRPWRLAVMAGCRVFEVDLPHVAESKLRRLVEAGAQWSHGEPTDSPPAASASALAAQRSPPTFPLLADSYSFIDADLSFQRLDELLSLRGFEPATPTLWVLEALLYYMPLANASSLLCELADLSAPGSRLIATCVDRELLEASVAGLSMSKGHVFAGLWHFEAEALLYDTDAFATRWAVDWAQQPPPPDEAVPSKDPGGDEQAAAAEPAGPAAAEPAATPAGPDGPCSGADEGSDVTPEPSSAAGHPPEVQSGAAGAPHRRLPASTQRLALERLGAETYVALYGGSELLFSAGLRQHWPAADGLA